MNEQYCFKIPGDYHRSFLEELIKNTPEEEILDALKKDLRKRISYWGGLITYLEGDEEKHTKIISLIEAKKIKVENQLIFVKQGDLEGYMCTLPVPSRTDKIYLP